MLCEAKTKFRKMNKHLLRTIKMDDSNIKIIYQFLINHQFESTAGTFIAEAIQKGFNNVENTGKIGRNFDDAYEQIVSNFNTGNGRHFFKIWNSLIPEGVKESKEFKILTLNLHVHFAVLPKRLMLMEQCKEKCVIESNSITSINSVNESDSMCNETENFRTEIEKNKNDNMRLLHEYLKTVGKELENETLLRPYFALPFIEDPYAEPSLSKIFNESWLDELIGNLYHFLHKYEQILKYSGNILCSNEDPNKLCTVQEPSSPRTTPNDNTAHKYITKNDVPIIPNDRNIPAFLQDNESSVQYNLCSSCKHNQKCKGTQTYVSGRMGLSSPMYKNDNTLIQYTQELAKTKSHLCTLHANYEKLKLRFHKLHADYHKLISVSGELTVALENSVKGQAVDLQAMLETCIKIFPDLFNQNIRDSSQYSSTLQLDKSNIDMNTVDHSPNVMPVSPKLLNFKKIKLHLINGNVKTKLFLLQALRRKITLGQPGERDEAIHEYISKDLLGLHGQIASDNGKSILPYLLNPGNVMMPHPLQQSAARLLNVLASFRCGRDYLSFGSTVVNVIFKCLNNTSNNEIDAFTCNMMIAMLQKLSLRKQQRIYMIDNGLVEWLIHHLHNECHLMDSYRLEYATALLMNLSLHCVAQKRASLMASLLISTLLTLLSINHVSALPYVNGALNNFLTNQTINEEAKKMKLSSALEHYRKNKSGEIRKHLDHILKVHRGEDTVNTENEDTADDDNEEFDVLENELEENDPVKNYAGELYGETLLATCYTISPKTVQEKTMLPDASSFKHSAVHSVHTHRNHLEDVIPYNDRHSVSYNYHFLPRCLSEEPNLKKQDNIITHERFIKKTALSTSLPPRAVQLTSSLMKDQRVFKPFAIEGYKFPLPKSSNSPPNVSNELLEKINIGARHSRKTKNNRPGNSCHRNLKANLNSTVKASNESAVCLYENGTSKESSETTIASSTILAAARESGPTEMEKLSSIASLSFDKDDASLISWEQKAEFDSEEAFRAKPKISRTPP